MPSIRLIKSRIKSVQNIAQITKAMEMVAASKMKKAQESAILGKPYAQKIYQITQDLASKSEKKIHPLFEKGNFNGRILLILISTNKGLCGGLNTSLFREILKYYPVRNGVDFISVGKKGTGFIVKSGYHLVADFSSKTPFTQNVAPIGKLVVEGFVGGNFKEVYLAYNSFQNAMKQTPLLKLLLPLKTFQENSQNTPEKETNYEFLIEPSIDEVLESLLAHYIENQIRSAILEGEASEHSARMMAMKKASEAALEIKTELTLLYNKVRQERITYEIADMVTARMAVG